MKLSRTWDAHAAAQGNQPGDNQGDVDVVLVVAVDGHKVYKVPSGSVTLAAEGGNLIGAQITLPGGRRLFVPAANLAGVIDSEDEGK